MSLSLLACSRMPRCSVHTANVFGVCRGRARAQCFPQGGVQSGAGSQCPTLSMACWSSLYSTWALERFSMALSTASLSEL